MDKEILGALANMLMMKLADELKWDAEYDEKTRKILNNYLNMHHNHISQGEKLEFTALDGLIMAGLMTTVSYYKDKVDTLENLVLTLEAELKLHRGAF